MSKNLMTIMSNLDESFIEDVLSLTENSSRESSRKKRLALSNSSRRTVMTHDRDYIKNVLGLSDMLLSSSKPEVVQREKGKYVEKVHQFVVSLCKDENLNSQVIRKWNF